MDKIIYNPIGIIHSPYKEAKGTPIQPLASKGTEGKIELFPEFAAGLKDLEYFSHLIILCHFHLIKDTKLQVTPYMDTDTHGIFATRAPGRPNSIGLSIVDIIKIEDNIIYIKNVDLIDGTPILDIKPYVPQFDLRENVRIGWLADNAKKLPYTKDDGRFIKE